jgi:hypothetical protein
MLETLFIASLIFLFLNRDKSKGRRRPRTLDAELRELIETSNDNRVIAIEIKRYLLSVIADSNNDAGKFTERQLKEAEAILEKSGANAFYWMSEIATQLALLAAAQRNLIPTNIDEELQGLATPEAIVNIVVKS